MTLSAHTKCSGWMPSSLKLRELYPSWETIHAAPSFCVTQREIEWTFGTRICSTRTHIGHGLESLRKSSCAEHHTHGRRSGMSNAADTQQMFLRVQSVAQGCIWQRLEHQAREPGIPARHASPSGVRDSAGSNLFTVGAFWRHPELASGLRDIRRRAVVARPCPVQSIVSVFALCLSSAALCLPAQKHY